MKFASELWYPALKYAIYVVGLYPTIAGEALMAYQNDGRMPDRVLRFEARWVVNCWLRAVALQNSDYVTSHKATVDILVFAEGKIADRERWYSEGCRLAIAYLYQRRLDFGVVRDLLPRDRNVHRSIFMVAVDQNSLRVIASLRYLGTILRFENGDVCNPKSIRTSLMRLESKKLIEIATGTRNPQHSRSNAISIAPYLETPDRVALASRYLIMSDKTQAALAEYTKSKKVIYVPQS